MTILLLLVATIGTLMIGKVSLFEQKAIGQDTRGKEVYAAVVGGLEYGVNYFKENGTTLVWRCGGAICDPVTDAAFVGASATAPVVPRTDPTVEAGTTDLGADSYDIVVSYTLDSQFSPDDASTSSSEDTRTGYPRIVTVTATATAQNDSQVVKTVEQQLLWTFIPRFSQYLDEGGNGLVLDTPPLTVEECMYDNTGTPDIYPNVQVQEGVAMMTTQGEANDACFDPGHVDLCVDDSANTNDTCYEPDEYSEMTQQPYRAALDPSKSLWSVIFGDLSKTDLLAMEREDPSQVYYVDSTYPHYPSQPALTGGDWKTSVGSEESPVIVFVDEEMECLDFGGADSGRAVTIWGLVYIEKPADADGCDNNGWGHFELYGVLAQEGNMYNLNANVNIYGWPVDFDNGQGPGGNDDGTIGGSVAYNSLVLKIPGTWRDFTDADYE